MELDAYLISALNLEYSPPHVCSTGVPELSRLPFEKCGLCMNQTLASPQVEISSGRLANSAATGKSPLATCSTGRTRQPTVPLAVSHHGAPTNSALICSPTRVLCTERSSLAMWPFRLQARNRAELQARAKRSVVLKVPQSHLRVYASLRHIQSYSKPWQSSISHPK